MQQGQRCELEVWAGAGGEGILGKQAGVWWKRWEVISKRNNTFEGLGLKRRGPNTTSVQDQ